MACFISEDVGSRREGGDVPESLHNVAVGPAGVGIGLCSQPPGDLVSGLLAVRGRRYMDIRESRRCAATGGAAVSGGRLGWRTWSADGGVQKGTKAVYQVDTVGD